jgi:hypothetical protein
VEKSPQTQTSLKELFQGMIPDDSGVTQARVIAVAPLKLQAVNDDKLTLSQNVLCVPRHLTDYETKCEIELNGGTIDSQTHEDGAHSQPDAGFGGTHVNHLETFNVWGAKLKVYNALKLGEVVYILSFNNGKSYYILDRIE